MPRVPTCGMAGYLAGIRTTVELGTDCDVGYQLNY